MRKRKRRGRLDYYLEIRSLLVGASVVVIVLGTFKLAMTLLDTGARPEPPTENTSEPAAADAGAAENSSKSAPEQQPRPRRR